MGEKGSRLTGTAVDVAAAIVEELAPLGEVTSKKMFGGVGIFGEGRMFVIVDSQGAVYLRDDDGAAFTDAGSSKHGRMPYWLVPSDVLADEETFRDWARRALEVATAAS